MGQEKDVNSRSMVQKKDVNSRSMGQEKDVNSRSMVQEKDVKMFHHSASRLLTQLYLCKLPCRVSGARAQYCPICTRGGYATRGFGGGVGMQKFPGTTRRCRAGSDVCRHHARMARTARRRITAGNQQHTTTLKSEQGCQQAGWQAGRQAGACCPQLHAPTYNNLQK
jgi:hypothetical protein